MNIYVKIIELEEDISELKKKIKIWIKKKIQLNHY